MTPRPRIESCEEAALAAARLGLQRAVEEGLATPAVLVVNRGDELSVLLAGPPGDVQLAGQLAIPGLSATTACLVCDTWTMELHMDADGNVPAPNMADIALNHGGLESGLVRESLTLSSFDREEGETMTARYYRRAPGGSLFWTPERDYRDDTPEGLIPRWLQQVFETPTLQAFVGDEEADWTDVRDSLILAEILDSFPYVQVATHRA